MKLARKLKGPIAVAKLDRLSRDISGLMKHRVPSSLRSSVRRSIRSRRTFTRLWRRKREYISQRTKEGLEQAKARGRTLGHPRIEELRNKGAVTLKA
jgi:hypothetical protein